MGDVREEELVGKVREVNEDGEVDGFMVEVGLGKDIWEEKVIERIEYGKDVDGFEGMNVGGMWIGVGWYVCGSGNGIVELVKG